MKNYRYDIMDTNGHARISSCIGANSYGEAQAEAHRRNERILRDNPGWYIVVYEN